MSSATNSLPPPGPNVTRHTLSPESELRIEVPTGVTCTVTLRSGGGTAGSAGGSASGTGGGSGGTGSGSGGSGSGSASGNPTGSAELFGAEIPPERPLRLTSTKVAIFTWHGCTLDVTNEDQLDILYVSEETDANVAYVNTHAQLEGMRDESLLSLMGNPQQGGGGGSGNGAAVGSGNGATGSTGTNDDAVEGPRVLLVGPADCGKSTLSRILIAYATKLGRTPLLVDMDASQNMLSVPGTLAVSPMSADSVHPDCFGTSSIMSSENTMTPLVLWYGSMDMAAHPDLYKAQLDKLGSAIDARLASDVDARASGIIVNSSGWIEDMGYTYLLHAIDAFRINVVLVLGHDRLYSMLGTHFKKKVKEMEEKQSEEKVEASSSSSLQQSSKVNVPKIIKLPRSGGVVSRDTAFRRATRSQSIKRYFYGDLVQPKPTESTPNTSTSATPQYQYTPSLLELPFSSIAIHKLSSLSLSASMLPVSSKQTTDPIQLTTIHPDPSSSLPSLTSKMQHAILAVCHPVAVEKWEESGNARDLFLSGVAGFVVVEKVDGEKEVISLLSPCAGSLPSGHLLVGDVSWLE